jgi:hypothetical protein
MGMTDRREQLAAWLTRSLDPQEAAYLLATWTADDDRELADLRRLLDAPLPARRLALPPVGAPLPHGFRAETQAVAVLDARPVGRSTHEVVVRPDRPDRLVVLVEDGESGWILVDPDSPAPALADVAAPGADAVLRVAPSSRRMAILFPTPDLWSLGLDVVAEAALEGQVPVVHLPASDDFEGEGQ